MLYNYLKVILRNFISDGMYTFIIIFGLAIGMAASLIIAQYVHFELSFDKQYKDKDRIFYTYMKWKNGGGNSRRFMPTRDCSINKQVNSRSGKQCQNYSVYFKQRR